MDLDIKKYNNQLIYIFIRAQSFLEQDGVSPCQEAKIFRLILAHVAKRFVRPDPNS